MAKYNSIEFTPKMAVTDKQTLALVYTPGVAFSCKEIAKDVSNSYEYTNRENTVGVFAYGYDAAVERALFLKSSLNIDAYPFEIGDISVEKLKFILKNLEPSFGAFDITLLKEELKNNKFEVGLPVLNKPVNDLKEFFLCISKNAIIKDVNNLPVDFKERSLALRKLKGGVIETTLSEQKLNKPVAIVSDGSAVLGLGNIGTEAGMPVMEGKAVLFKSLGNVNAMPLCVKTQKVEEIIELILLLENSFSGVNLEDISAPRCFEVEKELIEKSSIPIFHDDQHGTAIIVLSALINALKVVNKNLNTVKIVFSGAGAAATAVSKLIIKAGAKYVIMTDIDGIVYKGRKNNSKALEELATITNLNNEQGTLHDAIKNADVFIGLSAPNLLKADDIKNMNEKPIIFALANPTPEIMPDVAKQAGAAVVATGRSDFPNQVNNSLVFPGIFNAILSLNIPKITDEIKIATAYAISDLVTENELSEDFIIVDALNKQAPQAISESLKKNI